MHKIIKECKKELVNASELEKIKNTLKASLVYSMSSASGVARILGDYIANGDISPLYELEQKTAKLSANDLQKTAQKYFDKEQMTTIILKAKK